MLFPSSVLSALNVYFSSSSSPMPCFFLSFGLRSRSPQLAGQRWGRGGLPSLCFSSHGVGRVHQLNMLRGRGLSTLENSTFIQATQGSCLCTSPFCIQVIMLRFNFINFQRVLGAPQSLKQNPCFFLKACTMVTKNTSMSKGLQDSKPFTEFSTC